MLTNYRKGDKVILWCHNKEGVTYENAHATVLSVRKGKAYVTDGASFGMWIDVDKGKDWPICITPEVGA